ncbi:MAG: hypothetical protein Q8K92_05200 [Leadbetterella sp.]|nr:hypothetical protein [Leadbetterella sp.]
MRIFLSILLLCYCFEADAQTISASPGWSYSVPSGTISEAGTDYSLSPVSAANQTLISIAGFSIFATYAVTVHKIDTDWNSGLTLQVQRTGAGSTGFLGSTNGGAAYISLTNSPQAFFNGNIGFANGKNNVPIQYRIQGASVLLPVKTYTTTVVYTVSN